MVKVIFCKGLAMLSRQILLFGCGLSLAACTGPVNDATVRDMPTGYMCRLLNSDEYISLPQEQRAIYAELERRGAECVDSTHKLILQSN